MNEANQLVPSRTGLHQMVQKLCWVAALTMLTMMQPQGLMAASYSPSGPSGDAAHALPANVICQSSVGP